MGKKSLAKRMWVITAISLIIFGVSFFVAFVQTTEKAQMDSAIRESETLINGIIGNIRAGMNHDKDLSRLVMLNESVIKFLRAEEVDSNLKNDTRIGIMDILNVCTDVDSVYIFRNDTQYITTGKGIYYLDYDIMVSDEWQESILKADGRAVYSINGNSAILKKNGEKVITIARVINDILSQKRVGILMMNISENMLVKIISEQANSDICITSEKGVYIAGNRELCKYYNKAGVYDSIQYYENFNDNERVVIAQYTFEDIPLSIISSTVVSARGVPHETIIIFITILAAFIVSVCISGVFIARNITKPIMSLTSAMEKTKESGWIERIEVPMPQNEIGTLTDSYNSMIDYLNALFIQLMNNEESIRKAEMRVLQEQIKPHFLYNSLETIGAMAIDENAMGVHSALEKLGSFYRNFLSKGDREISFSRELNIIKDYLDLQQLRYGEEVFHAEYEIEDDTLNYRIPKLILQPLVENSINHGIRMKGEHGVILIKSCLRNDNLNIIVRDNGVGMSEEMIEDILSYDESDIGGEERQISSFESFGLKGTIARIRYYCNNPNVVKIRSVEGEYTEIELSIPGMEKGQKMGGTVCTE